MPTYQMPNYHKHTVPDRDNPFGFNMTTIIIPHDHLLIGGEQIIPEIEGTLGRNWSQPFRSDINIEIKDTSNLVGTTTPGITFIPPKYDLIRAYMSQISLKQLADYSRSQPSGVYPGKMWRAEITLLESEPAWYLMWYSEVPDKPNMCRVNACPILLTDMLDLLNPPQPDPTGDWLK